tara:strand:+ start:3509 stop:3676 length:168 start_codon:yes stop_codon:yes gene_type:complete
MLASKCRPKVSACGLLGDIISLQEANHRSAGQYPWTDIRPINNNAESEKMQKGFL